MSKYGHAFIVWQQENDNNEMSVADAIGFYPSDEDANTVDLIFGTNGSLESDAAATSDLKLTVLLNSDQFRAALDRKSAWQANGRYAAFWSNCVTHVASIAVAIGLKTSTGIWQTPQSYVSDLISQND